MRLWTRKTLSIWLLSASCLLATFQYSSFLPKEMTSAYRQSSFTIVVPALSIRETDSSTSTMGILSTTTSTTRSPDSTVTSQTTTTKTTVASPPRTTLVASAPAPTIPTPVGGEELRACIAHYESTDGLDPNWYQFTDGTWATYGGEGEPEDADLTEQTRIFWLAWYDDGPHHWAAQKGRCF